MFLNIDKYNCSTGLSMNNIKDFSIPSYNFLT